MPIGASELVWAIKVYFATITLGLLLGGAEVGWFAAAHRVVLSLHAFVWLYFYNLLPVIARKSQEPINHLEGLMKTSIQIAAWSAILLGVFGSLLAETGLVLLYGPQYQEAVPVFRVLIWVLPLTLLSGHYRYTLIGYDRQGLEFLSALVGAITIIVLNLALIPAFGLLGAAWAFVFSEAVIWLTAYLFVRRTIVHIPVFPHIRFPILAGILLVFTLYLLVPINLWLASTGALVVYLLVFLAFQPRIFTTLRSYLTG
jgi:O-antigen/teichoic acid export membrane protein